MLQKVENGYLMLKPQSKEEATKVKSWRLFKENKQEGFWYAELNKTMLEKVKKEIGLIQSAQTELSRLERIQDAVNYVRNISDEALPTPIKYPVKAKLFKHQQRGVLMALLTFGVLKPEDVGYK